MSIHWTISHAYQLVIAVAAAQTTIDEIEAHLRDIALDGGWRYRKLLVAASGSTLRLDEIKGLCLAIMQYGKKTSFGPLAVVIDSEDQYDAAADYVKRSAAGCPLAAFRNEQEARAWLMRQPVEL